VAICRYPKTATQLGPVSAATHYARSAAGFFFLKTRRLLQVKIVETKRAFRVPPAARTCPGGLLISFPGRPSSAQVMGPMKQQRTARGRGFFMGLTRRSEHSLRAGRAQLGHLTVSQRLLSLTYLSALLPTTTSFIPRSGESDIL
jgi:hypothetical protein